LISFYFNQNQKIKMNRKLFACLAIFLLIVDLGCGVSALPARKSHSKAPTLQANKFAEVSSRIAKGLVAVHNRKRVFNLVKQPQQPSFNPIACVESQCGGPISACNDDTKCKAVFTCVAQCNQTSSQCQFHCATEDWNPEISNLFHCVTDHCLPQSVQNSPMNCPMRQCGKQIGACFESTKCDAALNCVANCGTNGQCVFDCATKNWGPAMSQLIQCVAGECLPQNATDEVGECVMQGCQKQLSGCFGDAKCQEIFTCINACGNSGTCDYNCVTDNYDQAVSTLINCVAAKCMPQPQQQ
jgi:hypothetical protein